MVIDTQRLDEILTRLKLTAVRDQLDNLLEEIARQEMNFGEALILQACDLGPKPQLNRCMHYNPLSIGISSRT